MRETFITEIFWGKLANDCFKFAKQVVNIRSTDKIWYYRPLLHDKNLFYLKMLKKDYNIKERYKKIPFRVCEEMKSIKIRKDFYLERSYLERIFNPLGIS